MTTFTDTGLIEGRPLTYRVFATNSAGDSAPSTSVTATTLTAAPTGLTATPIAWNLINLSWTDHSSSASIRHRAIDQRNLGQVGTIYDTGAISFSATGPFLPSKTYYFRVAAYSATGGTSNYATVSTTTPAFPNQPTLLSATAQSDTSVLLTWSNPPVRPASWSSG